MHFNVRVKIFNIILGCSFKGSFKILRKLEFMEGHIWEPKKEIVAIILVPTENILIRFIPAYRNCTSEAGEKIPVDE